MIRIPTQSSLSIQNYCSSWLSCTISLSMSVFRGYSWFYLYFSEDHNTNKSMNNTWNGPSSNNNYCMIYVLIEFCTTMGCVVFYLITTPYKYDGILSIIIIIMIKHRFIRLTTHTLDTTLETAETRKILYHSLGSQASGCVLNDNSALNINDLYPTNIMSKFINILHLFLTKRIYC